MKEQKRKSANKTVYVDLFLNIYSKSNDDSVVANQLPNGKWECEIKLPLVEEVVKSVANTEIDAMANASDKAAPLIEKYLAEHPNIEFRPRSKFRHYEFFTDENGCAGFRLNSEYRKRCGEKQLEAQLETSKVIEKAVAKIKSVNNNDKNLFVQVIDRRFLADENASIEEIQHIIYEKMVSEFCDYYVYWVTTSIVDNYVIAVGYIFRD